MKILIYYDKIMYNQYDYERKGFVMKIHENEKCPVCDKIFKPDDDIVFCPQCGTPHHRECYNSLGKCVNADKHAEGFEYKFEQDKDAAQQNAHKSDTQRLNPNNIYYVPKAEESHKTVCKNCSKEIDSGVPFCPYCGAKQDNPQYKPVSPVSPFSPGAGREEQAYRNSKETIDGKKLEDVAAVVKTNVPRYINKFRKNKKISWNWGGFIFGPFYLFFRKMYKEGIITLVLRTVVTLVVQGMFADEVKKINDFLSFAMQNPESLQKYSDFTLISEMFNKAPTVFTAVFVTTLVINLIVALFSDMFYRKKVMAILDKVDENLENGGIFSQTMPFADEQSSLSQEEMRKIYLARVGGTSIFIPIIAYFALDLVLNIISML